MPNGMDSNYKKAKFDIRDLCYKMCTINDQACERSYHSNYYYYRYWEHHKFILVHFHYDFTYNNIIGFGWA